MNIVIGEKYLIDCDRWFNAPDGNQYKAVFGTVSGVYDDNQTLGIKTNRGSTNWYISIGNMIIAGCQIHYAFKCNHVNLDPTEDQMVHNGEWALSSRKSVIYNADNQG